MGCEEIEAYVNHLSHFGEQVDLVDKHLEENFKGLIPGKNTQSSCHCGCSTTNIQALVASVNTQAFGGDFKSISLVNHLCGCPLVKLNYHLLNYTITLHSSITDMSKIYFILLKRYTYIANHFSTYQHI